jgi:integrase/recombinase XerD
MTADGLRHMITKRTRVWLGQRMNLHSFRPAAATSIAIEDSEHVGIVTTILGHASFKTAERYYNKATALEAARRYQKQIVESKS